MKIYEVWEKTVELLTNLLSVWEASVRATHLFLSNSEIKHIKEYVPQALKSVEHLIVAENEACKPIAFIYGNGKQPSGNAVHFSGRKRKGHRQKANILRYT